MLLDLKRPSELPECVQDQYKPPNEKIEKDVMVTMRHGFKQFYPHIQRCFYDFDILKIFRNAKIDIVSKNALMRNSESGLIRQSPSIMNTTYCDLVNKLYPQVAT